MESSVQPSAYHLPLSTDHSQMLIKGASGLTQEGRRSTPVNFKMQMMIQGDHRPVNRRIPNRRLGLSDLYLEQA